jgi:hypothetical protein
VLLVRQTSKGLVGLHFHGWLPGGGFHLTIGVFDDAGWMSEAGRWGTAAPDGKRLPETAQARSLAASIAGATGLPDEEAEQFAETSLREWRGRGGEEEGRGDSLKGLALITGIGGGILLALAALIFAVILLVMLLT